MRGVKRRRTSTGFVPVVNMGKRPIDKQLVVIKKDGLAGSQVSTVLSTATFPCTITGLRWGLDATQDAGASGTAELHWAIVVVRDGNSASTLTTSDAGSLYQPEQDVLAFGTSVCHNSFDYQIQRWEGSTKTMRKMMGGDQLVFVAIGQATQTHALRGVVQFFCKS